MESDNLSGLISLLLCPCLMTYSAMDKNFIISTELYKAKLFNFGYSLGHYLNCLEEYETNLTHKTTAHITYRCSCLHYALCKIEVLLRNLFFDLNY